MATNTFTAKDIVKRLVWQTCGPSLQHKFRRFHAVRQISENRYYREPEMDLIKYLVTRGDRVADVGANVGVYTRELSLAAGPDGKVYSFEPVSENYDILTTVIQKLHLNNVEPFHVAIGSQSSENYMVIPEMRDFRGFYWAHLAGSEDSGRKEKVKVFALDELLSRGKINQLKFVKCDVEGGELDVLRGAVGLVNISYPSWLMEVSRETSSAVFSLFNQLGYDAFVYSSRLVRVSDYRDGEFSNYIFLHQKAQLNTSLC